VVLENDTIENIPDLRDPVIMILTYHIERSIYLSETHRHVVIIDEAHKFLKNPKIDLFLNQAYRRFRKHNASIIIGSQGFEDIWQQGKSEVGRVIVENSFWKFFLMQTSPSKKALRESNYFNLSEYEDKLMDSVKKIEGEYSEVYIISEFGSEKAVVVLSDFLKALFFTSPHLRERMKELVRQGMSYLEAVQKLQKEMIS